MRASYIKTTTKNKEAAGSHTKVLIFLFYLFSDKKGKTSHFGISYYKINQQNYYFRIFLVKYLNAEVVVIGCLLSYATATYPSTIHKIHLKKEEF